MTRQIITDADSMIRSGIKSPKIVNIPQLGTSDARTPEQPDRLHLDVLNLHDNPFPVIPDVNNYFLPERIKQLMAEVIHTIRRRRGFIVVLGEVGLGKTTFSRRILSELDKSGVQTALVINTFYQGIELLDEINKDFGLIPERKTFQCQMNTLNSFLLDQHVKGLNCVILIDDAQNLSIESLELIRQISNLETDTDKLVQILLLGQPELEDKLNQHDIRQLNSRIALKSRVFPYTLDEIKQYVHFKFARAGDSGEITVTDSGYKILHALSQGNPRKINLMLDRCLYGLVASHSWQITPELIREAAAELDIKPSTLPRHRRRQTIGLMALVLIAVFSLAMALGVNREDIEHLVAQLFTWVETPFSNTPTVAGSSVEQIQPEGTSLAAEPPHPAADIEASKPQVVVLAPVSEAPVAEDSGNNADSNSPYYDEIKPFLERYRLEEYVNDFANALENDTLGIVAQRIADATNYHMVRLKSLTPAITASFAVFSNPKPQPNGENILFWKPDYTVPHFFQMYTGDEIRKMQEQLKGLGYYTGVIDGIVGVLTIRAVQRIQSDQELPVTGTMDANTLFVLQRYELF